MKLKLLLFFLFVFFLSLPSSLIAAETCPAGENRYREGGDCEKESPFIHSTILQYPITCQTTPSISYHRESRTPPSDPNKAIVKIESNISLAELGGFGPSLEAINTKTSDALAALYPFNALFDKPPNTSPFNERESFRTYWRLLSNLQQANAKAAYLQQVKKGKINNQTYKFYNYKNQEKEWQVMELYNQLPSCLREYPVCHDFTKKYQRLNKNTQEAYDALMPFNFDNLRGYEVIKYTSPAGNTIVHIMAENLPYIAAINQGLLDPQTGLLNTLSPSWLNPKRQTNLTSDSVIKKDQETNLINNIKNYVQATKCQNPTETGLYLSAPLTFPQGLDNPEGTLEQTFEIPITTKTETKLSPLGIPYTVYISEGQGEGVSSVQILNNPKQKDISLGLAEDSSSSLFHMFTTASSQQPYQDKDLQAPTSQRTGESVNPNQGSAGISESEANISRKGGEPHIKLCELRNKWFIPASLQRNINCQKLDQSLSNLNPTITPQVCSAKQHLFENTCGQACYQEILDQTLSSSSCNGQVLNPYFAIAIALNENGGLVSGEPDGTSPKHFGCDPFGAAGVGETINEKLACMINTLRNKCQAGLSQEEILKIYGYEPGNNLENLIDLLEGPSNPQLFISPSQANQYANSLSALLPNQKDFWYYYYSGYIDNYCATH